MWPSQFDPEHKDLYYIEPSKRCKNLSYGLDEDLMYVIHEEAKLSLSVNVNLWEDILQKLEYTAKAPKLGITFTGYDSTELDVKPESIGFPFTRRGSGAGADDAELFIALDVRILAKTTSPLSSDLLQDFAALNFSTGIELLSLLASLKPNAAWCKDINFSDEIEADARLAEIFDKLAEDSILFALHAREDD